MSDNTLELTTENFEEKVINSDKPVLVDFWAEWCGPCKLLSPTIDSIATAFNGKVAVGKVNVDHHPTLAAEYNVRGIPNILIFKSGEVKEQLVGNVPEDKITEELNKVI